MNELQLKAPIMESVETVDVSWLHHSQKGQLYTRSAGVQRVLRQRTRGFHNLF